MDGYDATRMIRQDEYGKGRTNEPTPGRARSIIIGLTANVLHGAREKCLSCGMDDYLAKPVSRRVVLDSIEKWANDNSNNNNDSIDELNMVSNKIDVMKIPSISTPTLNTTTITTENQPPP